jgi:AbrB family looped-hinge helix DNA binding protein
LNIGIRNYAFWRSWQLWQFFAVFLPFHMANAIINGMTLKIDKAGRIVLPKYLRERLRLRPGSTLEVEERPEGVVLRPVRQKPSMVQKDGIWVHMGKLPRGFNWDQIVEDARDERIKDVAGL